MCTAAKTRHWARLVLLVVLSITVVLWREGSTRVEDAPVFRLAAPHLILAKGEGIPGWNVTWLALERGQEGVKHLRARISTSGFPIVAPEVITSADLLTLTTAAGDVKVMLVVEKRRVNDSQVSASYVDITGPGLRLSEIGARMYARDYRPNENDIITADVAIREIGKSQVYHIRFRFNQTGELLSLSLPPAVDGDGGPREDRGQE